MSSIHQILKKYWGYDNFRPLQEDIIVSTLNKNDTLALLPTGGGKSICFQVPALAMDGLCLVVSPLIALMKDQVENLQKKGIRAIAVTSAMSFKEIDVALENAIHGNFKFLYISPERLHNELFLARLSKMKVSLLAIDEAHCISQWGYDFRPSYLRIAEIREKLPNVPVLALTATATPEVVKDIQQKLHFKKENVLQKSFERKNLAYMVLYEEDKLNRLINICNKIPGTAVVYARNRKKTQEIALFLRKNNVSADFYHAGLSALERNKKQEEWINNKTRIMVATNAFGMGI
ncbi:MAG: RecQ family ATP-dependent DNA helicase, partial [Bacteroidia bacterium]